MSPIAVRATPAPVSDDARPLRQVLATLASELEMVRVLGLRVEGAICALAVQSKLDAAVVSELQQLDHVIQHIAALRDFSSALEAHCPDDISIVTREAVERVRLEQVRARLSGGDDDEECDGWEIL